MWIIAILFVLFFVSYPFVARTIARRRTLTRLCRALRREGARLRRLSRVPALCRNLSTRPALLVRVGHVQYAVKLWSPKHRNAELRVMEEGKVCETRTVVSPVSPRGERPPRTLRGRTYQMPRLKLRLRTPSTIKQVNILLIVPSYRRILRREADGWRTLSSGDEIAGMLLYTPSDFLVAVREQAKNT